MALVVTVTIDRRRRECCSVSAAEGALSVEVTSPSVPETRALVQHFTRAAAALRIAWGAEPRTLLAPAFVLRAKHCPPWPPAESNVELCWNAALSEAARRFEDRALRALVEAARGGAGGGLAGPGLGLNLGPDPDLGLGSSALGFGGLAAPAPAPTPGPRAPRSAGAEAQAHAEQIRRHIAIHGCAPNFRDPEKQHAAHRYIRSVANLQAADLGLVEAIRLALGD